MKLAWLALLCGCGFHPSAGDLAPGDLATPDLASDGAPHFLRVFVTRGVFVGNLAQGAGGPAGLAGGDFLCNDAAGRAGLGGAWVAWLSTSTTDAIARVGGSGPWYRVDVQLAFGSHTDLGGGGPLVPLSLDEHGVALAGGEQAWTGTAANGRLNSLPGPGNGTCDDWTTNAPTTPTPLGTTGSSDVNDDKWTDDSSAIGCEQGNHLYCFEQ